MTTKRNEMEMELKMQRHFSTMETTTRHAREATRARQDVAAYIAIRVRDHDDDDDDDARRSRRA